MPGDEITEKILTYIRKKHMDGDVDSELDETTPLFELGIMNSLHTLLLLQFIRDELGVAVPANKINAANFKNVRSITALVRTVAGAPAS